MPPTPIALSPALPSELITYALSQSSRSITLIICQTRASFLSSLHVSVTSTQPSLPPDNEAPDPEPEPQPLHPLLVPTLRQIATSRSVKLVFIPTVSHLRAYLAVFPSSEDAEPRRGFDEKAKKRSLLVMYGLVELHRDTSEWSAQGLGNSIAGLVEAGWRGQREVVVIEERKIDQNDGFELGDLEIDEEETRRRDVVKVWGQRVPMLNGSVRRTGMESEDGGWSGRTVEVGRILGRWFRFEEGHLDRRT